MVPFGSEGTEAQESCNGSGVTVERIRDELAQLSRAVLSVMELPRRNNRYFVGGLAVEEEYCSAIGQLARVVARAAMRQHANTSGKIGTPSQCS
jgi:hypothetical protein